MIKSDFEILVTGCMVAVILVLLNFGQLLNSADDLSLKLKDIRQSDNFKTYESFKKAEGEFWAEVKGTSVNKGTFSSLQDIANSTKNTNSATPPITPTPSTSPTSAITQPTPTPTKQGDKIKAPVKFLLVGDSMMLVGFGPALENDLLGYKDVSVVREGAFSTGLNRIDYFDWYARTDELIAESSPDVLVVMFGANDGQGILDLDGNPYQLDEPHWKEVYQERVNLYLTKFAPKVKKIYWVGHPIAGNDDFMGKFLTMNPIYQAEVAKFPNAVYVDTWTRFSVNGEYSQSIPDDNGLWQIAKQSDGVHVTDFGGEIMSELTIKEILKGVDMQGR
jgi:hypothetical protein